MKTPAVEVKNLVKRYGEKTAVNNVSFDIKPGEFFGFLGPNGAGKTSIPLILRAAILASPNQSASAALNISLIFWGFGPMRNHLSARSLEDSNGG